MFSTRLFLFGLLFLTRALSLRAAAPLLVDNGQPRAQIVIAEHPARAVPVAARELQAALEKISGAKLPIVTTPDAAVPLRIFVGRSAQTDALGLSDEGLEHGAFRIVSGDSWLALLGRDRDYVFREPYAHSLADGDRVLAEWQRLSGTQSRSPYGLMPLRHFNKELNLWNLDGRGSINAVYRFLGDLGARWYLPGPLGEVLPQRANIPLPRIDETVRPDFAFRNPHSRANFTHTDEALWAMRMGWNPAPEIVGPYAVTAVAHGTDRAVNTEANRREHPEIFALINGKRFMPAENPSYCFSSPELLAQNVRWLRAIFDLYDPLMVSVQPADSHVNVCQCPLCAGKETPDRGPRGSASDYVWEYIDRVARELLKTHPQKKIAALAYANYALPPERIAQLSPNILLGAPSGRTFTHNQPAEIERVQRDRAAWLEKLPEGSRQIYHYEYFMDARPGRRTQNLPVFMPHTIARSLREVKGICLGEHIDTARYSDSQSDLGVLGLNLYVTSRLWWKADDDLEAMLDEYAALFYGPAREPMKKLIAYSEAHWTDMPSDAVAIHTYFDLLAAARAATPEGSVYRRRLALLEEYTRPMKSLLTKLERGRDETVPPVILRGPRPAVKAAQMTIDGRLDELVWQRLPGKGSIERVNLPSYALHDAATGAKPKQETAFSAFWTDGALYVGIHCRDSDTAHLNIASRERDDVAIRQGDCVELHFETQNHSFYTLAVNPSGALLDVDHRDGAPHVEWNAKIDAAAHIGDGEWTVELRIPVMEEREAEIVELGKAGVMGRQPAVLYPWYVNLARERVRGAEIERSAWSTGGQQGFDDPSKFARLSPAR